MCVCVCVCVSIASTKKQKWAKFIPRWADVLTSFLASELHHNLVTHLTSSDLNLRTNKLLIFNRWHVEVEAALPDESTLKNDTNIYLLTNSENWGSACNPSTSNSVLTWSYISTTSLHLYKLHISTNSLLAIPLLFQSIFLVHQGYIKSHI